MVQRSMKMAQPNNSLVLFVKDDDNDIEKINEYPIDIDEKHQVFYIRKDPANRFKTILSLIHFYTTSTITATTIATTTRDR